MQPKLKPVSIPLPPPWARRFLSNDLDEIRDYVAGSVGEHSRVAHGTGPVGFALHSLSGAAVKIGWGRTGLAKTVRGAVPDPTLHLFMPSGSTYRVGRRSHVAAGAAAMLLAPGWEFTRWSPAGSILAISVQASKLAAEIEARCVSSGLEVLFGSRAIDLSELERARLVAAALELAQAMNPLSDFGQAQRAEAHLVAAIADLLLRETAFAHGRSVANRRLLDVEQWIDAHVAEPITVGRLCQVAGVGERCLQKAFEARRGMSPMRFVVERRLTEARRRLQQPGKAPDVTSVALGLGFGHVGRFSRLYREAFGERPSQSRARRAP